VHEKGSQLVRAGVANLFVREDHLIFFKHGAVHTIVFIKHGRGRTIESQPKFQYSPQFLAYLYFK